MGFLASAFEQRSVTVVGDDLWRSWKSTSGNLSGVTVTPETAMTFAAVFAAHKILAESTAMLPLFLYKRLTRGKEHATDKRLYGLLHDIANPEMDAYLFRETLTAHLAGWGRAHAKIDYDVDGQITALWPIHPSRVFPDRNMQKQLIFHVDLPDGTRKTYRQDEMLFLRGMSVDGINVYSPIKLARQGIGLALAAEGYGAAFFGNSATPKGLLETDKALSEKAFESLNESWNASHQGISQSNKIAILEEGVKWKETGISNDDAQFLQTRIFQVEEIARWYRIPLSMMAVEKTMTYASVEAFGLQFVMYTLYPWLVRWEKGLSQQLLLERERKKYFFEHLMTALVRGDTQTRNQAYATGRQWGWLSANDVRDFENMNPIDGGDMYLTPANMENAGGPHPVRKIQGAYMPVLTDALNRILKRETNDIRGAMQKVLVKRGPEAFADWLSAFYDDHRDFIVRNLAPAAESYAEMIGNDGDPKNNPAECLQESLKLFAMRRAGQMQDQFRDALREADPREAIEGILAEWNNDYIEHLAKMEIGRQTAVIYTPNKEAEWIQN